MPRKYLCHYVPGIGITFVLMFPEVVKGGWRIVALTFVLDACDISASDALQDDQENALHLQYLAT